MNPVTFFFGHKEARMLLVCLIVIVLNAQKKKKGYQCTRTPLKAREAHEFETERDLRSLE